MLWDLQLLYLICLPFPVLCLSDLLVTLVWHGLSVSPQNSMDCCLLFVSMDLSSDSTRSFVRDIFFVVYAWRLEYVERFPDLGLSIITKWVPRFVVFCFFSVVALSETDGFVMSTLDWLLDKDRWRLRRGFAARISSVTSFRFYRGDRVRSIVSVHCRGFFLSVDGQRLWRGQNRRDYIRVLWEEAWCGQDQDCRRWVSGTGSPHVRSRRVCPGRVFQWELIVFSHFYSL